MDENTEYITLGFTYKSSLLNTAYTAESTFPLFPELGEMPLERIGDHLSAFLKQCGYILHGDNILIEGLTDEEYDAVVDFLKKYRENKTNGM